MRGTAIAEEMMRSRLRPESEAKSELEPESRSGIEVGVGVNAKVSALDVLSR